MENNPAESDFEQALSALIESTINTIYKEQGRPLVEVQVPYSGEAADKLRTVVNRQIVAVLEGLKSKAVTMTIYDVGWRVRRRYVIDKLYLRRAIKEWKKRL